MTETFMKILIIGAKGMLGQELVKAFQKGNEVLAWDTDEVDITRIKNCELRIKEEGIELIINSAAYNNVDGSEMEFELANQVNGYAVGDLAAICKDMNIPLVHYSTEYVFDGTKQDGYAEGDIPNPVSKYGESKYLGEQELQKNGGKYYLIRLSRMFGKASAGGKKSFVELMLELARTKKEIEVVDEELSCPTFAPDLAKLTRYIIDKGLPYGIYHGANSGACTWFGFAGAIFKIAKLNVKLIPVAGEKFKRPAKRPRYGILLNTKLPAQRRWEESLREFVHSY
ncbi:dTDP-4-dehydrorhamnose reductase [bacterium]|nr:MAG: dTDP-4-dehydrorhamnose reductase [bacterium]